MAYRITVITGSRADWALLEYPISVLQADPFFDVTIRPASLGGEFRSTDLIMVLGDRHEILREVVAAHLQRIPIAHWCGGDVTEGSYDDAMRDCISRMASIHFVTSTSAMARLTHMGLRNVHLVGNPGIDVIRRGQWRATRPIEQPYVVVSYQAETIDGTIEMQRVFDAVAGRYAVFFTPNDDAGAHEIKQEIIKYCDTHDARYSDGVPHGEFLNLLAHCEEFIGNSSAMLYEAPELEIKTLMIGKRQRGRVIPWGDGEAAERARDILKYTAGAL